MSQPREDRSWKRCRRTAGGLAPLPASCRLRKWQPGSAISGGSEEAPCPDEGAPHVESSMDQRSSQRKRTILDGRIVFNKRSSVINCMVRDLSDTGARIAFGHVLDI